MGRGQDATTVHTTPMGRESQCLGDAGLHSPAPILVYPTKATSTNDQTSGASREAIQGWKRSAEQAMTLMPTSACTELPFAIVPPTMWKSKAERTREGKGSVGSALCLAMAFDVWVLLRSLDHISICDTHFCACTTPSTLHVSPHCRPPTTQYGRYWEHD